MTLTHRHLALAVAVAALTGFSAGVATKPQQQQAVAAVEIPIVPVYRDPSLAGLAVAANAEVDLDPGKTYY